MPPQPPKIFNERGENIENRAGPYEEGVDLQLICVVMGGRCNDYVDMLNVCDLSPRATVVVLHMAVMDELLVDWPLDLCVCVWVGGPTKFVLFGTVNSLHEYKVHCSAHYLRRKMHGSGDVLKKRLWRRTANGFIRPTLIRRQTRPRVYTFRAHDAPECTQWNRCCCCCYC